MHTTTRESFKLATNVDGDVEVTNIESKRWVWKGKEVPVRVTLYNHGQYQEVVDLTLEDTTEYVLIGKQTVTIPPETYHEVTFNWKTKESDSGGHRLCAKVIPGPGKSQPVRSSYQATSQKSHRVENHSDSDLLSPFRRNLKERATTIQTTRLMRLAERKLENAKAARDEAEEYKKRSEDEARRQAEEIYQRFHFEAVQKAEDLKAEALRQAEELKKVAQQEIENAKAAMAEAERYKQQAEEEVIKAFEEVYDRLHVVVMQKLEQARPKPKRQTEEPSTN